MFRLIVLTCLTIVAFAPRTSTAEDQRCVVSEVWEVSTRHLACNLCNLHCPPLFEVNRWDGCRWQRASLEELLRPSEKLGVDPLTIVYVHGNWMERNNALERVRIIDRAVAKRACEPFKLVMLSWPSQHEARLVREVRDHADCADVQSFYLAWLLKSINAGTSRVSLLGFSFGARTVTGALQLEAGGKVLCREGLACEGEALGESSAAPMHRVSLVAPAVDKGLLSPRGKYALAMNRVDHMVNLYNSRDPVLRRFRFIDSVARPIAAGFTGLDAVADPPSTVPLEGQDRVEQFDCGSAIGVTHSELSYYTECSHFRTAVDNLLWK